ncbi:MAG: hypothetical protein MJY56_04995, partial [Bacteroidales bacterium]|nr:hypothetical protein [Bacteroidales bacterium]
SNKQNDVTARVKPTALDVYFGKWFCPELGLRLAYTGLTGSENSTGTVEGADDKLLENFGFAYVHGDVMWNFINTIWGYRRDRVWNINPYVHCGWLRLYDVTDDANEYGYFSRRTNTSDNEFAAGFGLLNTFRMAERWHFTFDVRNMMFSARFHNWDHGGISNALTATIGVQYWIGRTDWSRGGDGDASEALAALAAAEAALAAAEAANKDLQDKNDDLQDKNDDLEDENEALRNRKPEVIENTDTVYVGYALGIAPIRLFFDKNISDLSVTEKMHLKYYVETVISIDPDRKFNFTGFADKGTGNEKINTRLANDRVNKTIDFLVNEYGISRDRLIFRDAVISDENSDPRLDRSVLIEH